MLRAIDISTSGLIAQRQRMDTIAGNIANVNTTRNADGTPGPFQRRLITFSADDQDGKLDKQPVGVRYQIEIDSSTPSRRVHQPGHPDADKDGYVSYPNINVVTEFVNALEAGRAYEANLATLEMTKQMANLTLRVLS